MTLENELKDLMIKKSKSIRQFACEVDIPATTIQSMLNSGIENAGVKKVMKICDFLGIDTDALADGYIKEKTTSIDGITYNELEVIKKYRCLDNRGRELVDIVLDKEYRYSTESPREFIMLEEAPLRPRYPRLASAGTGQYVFDDIPPELVEIDEDYVDSDFVIGVNGDSMEPTYHDYDDLIVKKQPKVNVGEIGIFMINGEAFVKEFKGDRLHSHNPSYKDIILNENMDIHCIGKVIGKRRMK